MGWQFTDHQKIPQTFCHLRVFGDPPLMQRFLQELGEETHGLVRIL